MKNTSYRALTATALLAIGILSAPTQPASATDISTWQRQIAKVVAKKQVYPRSALQREIEGQAKVKVTVDRTGKIANYEIIQSTGSTVLDRAVPRLMARIDPLPAPPADAEDNKLTFILPLAWVLQ